MVISAKEKKYQEIAKLARSLLSSQDHLVSNMANLSALLYRELHFWWVGFYLVDEGKQELYLGPFQGPTACTRIAFGKGVCGSAWASKEAMIVPDVHQFKGHIACSSESNSEIVVPLIRKDKVVAVLDVDSTHFNHFDEIDQKYLEEMLSLLL